MADGNAEVEAAPPAVYGIDILTTTSAMQLGHGMRVSDYERYRQYATRRLRRLYKALNFTHGQGKKFVTRPVASDTVTDERFLLLLLLQVERCWAYAEDLFDKQASSPCVHHHILKKRRKAVKWADSFAAVASERCDEATQKQVNAYAAEQQAYLLFSQSAWQKAEAALVKAGQAWLKVPGQTADSRELIHTRVGSLEQKRRACWYKLNKNLNDFVPAVDTQKALTSSTTGQALQWRGRAVTVPEGKVAELLRDANQHLESIRQQSKKVAESGTSSTTLLNIVLESYDKLLLTYTDAVAATKQKLKTDSESEDELQRLLHYLNYSIQLETRNRNLFLVRFYTQRYDTAKAQRRELRAQQGPAEIVRLYDLIVENANGMLEIPGVEDDEEKAPGLEQDRKVHKAASLYWKAEGLQTIQQSYAEAFACLTYAEETLTEVLKKPAKGSDAAEVKELADRVRGAKALCTALANLSKQTENDDLAQEFASLSLDSVFALQPIPVRPIFFDIAGEYLQEEEEEVAAKETKKEAKAEKPKQKQPAQQQAQQPQQEQQGGGWLKKLWGR